MTTTPLPPCEHHKVMTWKTDDGTPVLWSCVECAMKFEPITARADLEAENQRLREALQLALEYWQHRQQRYKNRSPIWVEAARAALENRA